MYCTTYFAIQLIIYYNETSGNVYCMYNTNSAIFISILYYKNNNLRDVRTLL